MSGNSIDESSLEGELFKLMKEYEKPVSIDKPKVVEPYPSTQQYAPIRYGPTLSERVSGFLHEHPKIIRNIVTGIIAAITLAPIANFFYSSILYEIKSPGVEVDSGSHHKIFLKGGHVNVSDTKDFSYKLLVEETDEEWKQAVLSPDEVRVALAKYCGYYHLDSIFIINTDGSRLSQLTFPDEEECDHDPFWVDNDTIGFLRSNDEEQYLQIDVDENNVGYNLRPYEPVK